MIRLAGALTLALAPLAAACGSAPAREAPVPTTAVDTIDAAALSPKVAAGEVRLIDVRTAEEFASGHIAGAVNMPLASFDPAKLASPGDARPVVLYCRSAKRSAVAAERLATATGATATHLAGGILAWEAAGQPVAR